ncbi:MAG TPA: CHASE domain-containing protein [Parvibaculum sp.]
MSTQFRIWLGRQSEFAPIALVWALGTAIAAALFVFSHAHYQNVQRERFQRDAIYYSTIVTETLERHVNSLKSLRAFVASRDVTRWEFSSFAAQTLPNNHGFKAVFWVPEVPHSARKAYEANFQRDGLYGLRIRQVDPVKGYEIAGTRPFYLPVTYVDPLESNQDLIGLDLATDPDYRDLLALAARTNSAVMAPLKSASRQPANKTLLVTFPLRAGQDGAAEPDAHAPIKGYAVGILDLNELVAGVLPKGSPIDLIVSEADAPASGSQAAYIDTWLQHSSFSQARDFSIANQKFVVAARSSAGSETALGFAAPLGLALCALVLTGLLAQHLYNSTMYNIAVERAVVARTAELNSANAALREEVALRSQAETRLRIAKEKTEAANRAKSEFLTAMSHRLRTPLNDIIGLSETMIQEVEAGNGAVRIRRYVEDVNSSGLTLLQLVNELLGLSQLDAENVPLKEEQICVADLIKAAAGRVKIQAKSAGVALKSHCPDDTLSIRADERLLTKALVHLLSNAIQFTPGGGEAELFAQTNMNGTVSFVVRDTGIGIPADKIEHILEPFVRLATALPHEHDGAGLGLPFVNRVARLLGFRLSIESEQGAGTRVSLTCPRERILDQTKAA